MIPKAAVRFRETMEGTWRASGGEAEGESRPVSFTVTAHVDDVLEHLRDGNARLEGFVDAEGLAAAAPAEGTLEIKPLERLIRYTLAFKDDQGRDLTLVGRKELSLLDLLGSMTNMEMTVSGPDGEVGRGHMKFDLGSELLPMLLSMRAKLG